MMSWRRGGGPDGSATKGRDLFCDGERYAVRWAKGLAKRIANRLGYSVTAIRSPAEGESERAERRRFEPLNGDRYRWVRELGIRTVLDVGGHSGESAARFHALLPEAKIYSFEPLPESFHALERTLAGLGEHECFNVALGETPGHFQMNRSAFSQSSSLLDMTALHKNEYPFSAGGTSEMIRVETLDGVVGRIDLRSEVLLKIDVQGFEKSVLRGAAGTLPKVKLVIVEVSFFELYCGQSLALDVFRLLEESGFRYAGAWDQLLSPRDGTPLQQDAIFVRGAGSNGQE